MSDQFQHVMVLTSIIIGLGITNALLGISGAIERYTESDRPLYLGWASAFWLGYVFLWMVDFWWWEFRLVDILKHWTLWDYFFIICYAVLLFLLVAFLVPRNWDKVDDLNAYFMAKRRWFYSANALALVFDLSGFVHERRDDLCEGARFSQLGFGRGRDFGDDRRLSRG